MQWCAAVSPCVRVVKYVPAFLASCFCVINEVGFASLRVDVHATVENCDDSVPSEAMQPNIMSVDATIFQFSIYLRPSRSPIAHFGLEPPVRDTLPS